VKQVGFIWGTNVGIGDDIDAADRNETRTNIEWLYNALGVNWPGSPRWLPCVGAGFDIAAPCPVVWPIAVGDSIYQTPGAHPISELQEERDKLDWIWDNRCGVDNAAANATTLGAANPTTQIGDQLATDAGDQLATDAGDQLATQAGDQLATEFQDQMGNVAHCPLEFAVNDGDYTGYDNGELTGAAPTAFGVNQGDLAANLGMDNVDNSGVYSPDYGGVNYNQNVTDNPSVQWTNNVLVDIPVNAVYNFEHHEIDNSPAHCYAENAGVYTQVLYDDEV